MQDVCLGNKDLTFFFSSANKRMIRGGRDRQTQCICLTECAMQKQWIVQGRERNDEMNVVKRFWCGG